MVEEIVVVGEVAAAAEVIVEAILGHKIIDDVFYGLTVRSSQRPRRQRRDRENSCFPALMPPPPKRHCVGLDLDA